MVIHIKRHRNLLADCSNEMKSFKLYNIDIRSFVSTKCAGLGHCVSWLSPFPNGSSPISISCDLVYIWETVRRLPPPPPNSGNIKNYPIHERNISTLKLILMIPHFSSLNTDACNDLNNKIQLYKQIACLLHLKNSGGVH